MDRLVQITKDGSSTICIPNLDVTYHSRYGAMQESIHVFIQAGLDYFVEKNGKQSIIIFEMGFGTGLNALLTLDYATRSNLPVIYEAVELYPLTMEEAATLNYTEQPSLLLYKDEFKKMHACNWDEQVEINPFFRLRKTRQDLLNYLPLHSFDLIYYDAFAPSAQPHLWEKTVFDKLYNMLSPPGVLTTYCSKGDVRRAMIASGFAIEKLQGPPGKREMLRGTKQTQN
ncbi:tRNA (5-methylaminomethyl-2-thiouridine)(34)-methyltransferase MnmD [Danxiaibacter flavus]|uniref:tRNA (5-methylaminomethyl-2-thiouridine)(34)-methyltransferase MnmD n=1 Tax=Danxiaibacter flavus TaxID=3049108 RepID=A0ABV3ZQF7_9BACT|nr:tRNA (5-methylaminomethyl-2-thiouridine)(34)-methyltransferase MnmD [Chitinophagaceae bacterium DXS]